MNELTIKNQEMQQVQQIDYKEKALEYLNSMGNKLPNRYLTQFIEMAQAFNLNPFKREIYAVGYGENWNIITGYEVYLKRAERVEKLNGWKAWTEGDINNNTLKAIVRIKRKDWEEPFIHEVYYEEVVNKNKDGKPNAIWAKMPKFMTKKVAIAQGFRMCFPDEFGGMPYTNDEIGENLIIEEVKITPEPKATKKIAPTVERNKEIEKEIANIMQQNNDFFNDEIKKSFRQMLVEKGANKTLEEVKIFVKVKQEQQETQLTEQQEKDLGGMFND